MDKRKNGTALFLFALGYRNVIKEKGNLLEIEKGTVDRNKKTNKNNEKYKGTHDSHLVIKILLNYKNEIC